MDRMEEEHFTLKQQIEDQSTQLADQSTRLAEQSTQLAQQFAEIQKLKQQVVKLKQTDEDDDKKGSPHEENLVLYSLEIYYSELVLAMEPPKDHINGSNCGVFVEDRGRYCDTE